MYDINTLEEVVRTHFGVQFPRTAILTTASDPTAMAWLATLAPNASPTAVGVDDNATPEAVNEFFRTRPVRYTYANGTSVPLLPTTCYLGEVRRAIALRAAGSGPGFRLVYAWTVTCGRSMRAFLDSDVDGMITDKIEKLRRLLQTDYATSYVLATSDHNPF